jgi:hypothetical protein
MLVSVRIVVTLQTKTQRKWEINMSTELYRQLVASFCIGSCSTLALIALIVGYIMCRSRGESETAATNIISGNNWEERSHMFVSKK